MSHYKEFSEFHAANPQVYLSIVLHCRRFRAKHGRNAKLGIKMLFEVMRWDHLMSTDAEDFKLNNNYTSYYARLVMRENPDLDGIFNVRELR